MSIVDDDRIDIGNVHAAFHDIGANEYIVSPVDEVEYPLFQQVAFHLAMHKAHTQVRAESLYDCSHFAQASDPVINKENLSSPFCFEIYRVADKILVINLHLGLNRLPVRRGRINDTEITGTHKRKLEGAGDR